MMNAKIVLYAAALAACCGSASAVDVLMLSSGNQSMDSLVMASLSARGHHVVQGPAYHSFDGSLSLAPYDVVYLQPNYNWGSGDMPLPGQTAIQNWVSTGGGLVTCEWTIWKSGALGHFATLSPVFAAEITSHYTGTPNIEVTRDQFDPIFSAGLPTQFTLPMESIGGTETNLQPRTGATVFFRSNSFGGSAAALGRAHGSGRVVNLSSVMGFSTVADGHGATLLSNALNWAADVQECYADCDTFTGARVLDIFDFLCFSTKFGENDPYACDCDQGSGQGVCDIFDFLCFQNAFGGGCP